MTDPARTTLIVSPSLWPTIDGETGHQLIFEDASLQVGFVAAGTSVGRWCARRPTYRVGPERLCWKRESGALTARRTAPARRLGSELLALYMCEAHVQCLAPNRPHPAGSAGQCHPALYCCAAHTTRNLPGAAITRIPALPCPQIIATPCSRNSTQIQVDLLRKASGPGLVWTGHGAQGCIGHHAEEAAAVRLQFAAELCSRPSGALAQY